MDDCLTSMLVQQSTSPNWGKSTVCNSPTTKEELYATPVQRKQTVPQGNDTIYLSVSNVDNYQITSETSSAALIGRA